MDIILSIIFLCFELVFIISILLLIAQTGFVRLESIVGVARDGFPAGASLPAWSLFDLNGQLRRTPSGDCWQFLIFVDHALGGFPDLIAGMQYIASTVDGLEVLVLSRSSKSFNEAMVRGLDLKVPVVSVDPSFYIRFRVRVMPFAFLLDTRGTVRWAGVVNTKALLLHVWHIVKSTETEPDNSFIEEVKG